MNTTLLLLGFAAALGYIAGRVDLLVFTRPRDVSADPVGFFQKNKPKALRENTENPVKVADIDSSKFVAPISTAGMARNPTTALGKTTLAEDDIQAAASRLAQLKGR